MFTHYVVYVLLIMWPDNCEVYIFPALCCMMEPMYPKICNLFHLFSQLLFNYCRGMWRWTNRVSSVSLNRMCPCWDTNICYHCRDRNIIFEVQRWSRLVLLCIVINIFVKMFLWLVEVNGEELLAPCPTPELEDHCYCSWFLLPFQYFLGNQMKKNEMGGACGTHWKEERFIQGFAGENWREETTWRTYL